MEPLPPKVVGFDYGYYSQDQAKNGLFGMGNLFTRNGNGSSWQETQGGLISTLYEGD